MSRALFKGWGLELSPDDFARAVAARGMLEAANVSTVSPGTAQGIYTQLSHILVEAKGAIRWSVSSPGMPPWFKPAALAEAWKLFITGLTALQIEISALWEPFDPIWLVEELSRPEVGIASVYVAKERRSHDRWHWPLRVGFLPDRNSADLLRAIERQARSKRWHKDLTTLIRLGEVDNRCDLLLIPHGPRAALARILDVPAALRATSVILLGPVDCSRADTVRLMKAIDDELYTNAMAFVSGEVLSPALWLHKLVTELSHDHPFDLAFTLSLGKRSECPSSLLLANGVWNDQVRVSKVASSLEKELKRPEVRVKKLRVDIPLATRLNVKKGMHMIADLPPMLKRYDEENRGATTLVHFTKAVHRTLRKAAPPPAERRLQAQAFEVSGGSDGALVGPVAFFRASAVHQIDVRIGLPEIDWISSPTPFPDKKLPPSIAGHRLTVVFVEPDLAPEPQISHIFLPPTGLSGTCSFHLKAPADATEIHARIAVSYKNRVLQTSILEGPVKRSAKQSPHGAIKMVPEVVVSAGMADLDRQASYGGALVFNQTKKGTHKVLKLVDDSAVLISTGVLSKYVQKIEGALGRSDWGHKDFRAIDAKGTLKLLRVLAAHGRLLYRGLVDTFFGDSQLEAAGRIQLIAAKPNSRLPVEYCYDLRTPGKTATICPDAAKAFKTGKCSENCSARKNPEKYLCPFAFWGMSKILEWHSFRPQSAGELQNNDYALQQERIALRKQLKPLTRATVGASDRANKGVKDSVPQLLALIKKEHVPSRFVNTWPEWKKSIGADSPSLLVLIPHIDTDQDLDVAKMEIGTEQWLTIDQLEKDYVRSPKVPPVVLLLGCDTAQQHVSFEDFISNFSVQGAAIIVASSTMILGRQATVLAQEFIKVMREYSGKKGKTFGDVMLTVRRNMMQQGYPMVLSVSSYGDADWRL
jgi:hypothetical protein